MQSVLGRVRARFRRIAPFVAVVSLVAGTVVAGSVPANAVSTATLVYTETLNNVSVNICSNSGDNGQDGNLTTCGGQMHVGGVAGVYWQCVEFAQRLYTDEGWHSGVFPIGTNGVAADIYSIAGNMGMSTEPNGSITSIAPGDMIVHGKKDKYSVGAGHVAVVDHVSSDGKTVYVVQQNAPDYATTYSLNNGTLTGGSGTDILGIVHSPNDHLANNASAPPPPPPGSGNSTNGTQVPLAGRFVQGDTGQDFIYITKNADNGWTASAWEASANSGTANKLTWAGNYFTQTGAPDGVDFTNTVFFTGDANGDGLTDLYYASSLNWDSPGFTVGVLYNMGNSFVYGTTVWTSTTLKLSQVKFLPGDWTGTGKQGFAYVDPTSDGGFEVSVFGVNAQNAFYSAGVWFTQPGPNVSYYNTKFIPLDANGDGKMDLYYASSQQPSTVGAFTVGYLQNAGSSLQWIKSVWAPSNLALATTQFIPGYWTGGAREGFMYVSENPDQGFATAVETPDANGNLVYDGGNWWVQGGPNVSYYNTVFIPADYNNDGYTDLFYATAESWSSGVYSLGLFGNTNGHYTGFQWIGNQGQQNSIPIAQTVFMPAVYFDGS